MDLSAMQAPAHENVYCNYCYSNVVAAKEKPVTLHPCAHKVHQLCAETLLVTNDKRCPVEGCGRLVDSYKITLIFKNLDGSTTITNVGPHDTVEQVKRKYVQVENPFGGIAYVKMIFNAQLLDDAQTIYHYNIRNGNTVHLSMKF